MKNYLLLTPFKIGSKTVNNRIFSTSQTLNYKVKGKATETTFLCHEEEAKGDYGTK
jgi:2,4-dienoyl-CoA reductase-like NADH-dependent reductase (Old Yellow Enzyme family)